jgi:dihydropteroate synthase
MRPEAPGTAGRFVSGFPVMRLLCRGQPIQLVTPAVMAVLNVTPDSFSDGGRYGCADAAIAQGLQMAEQGASIIDVGGESTRPGATAVDAAEEMRRVLPVIEGLAGRLAIPVSVDTSKPEVMRAAVAAGAGLINDVRALEVPGALQAAAASGAAVCLMHMRGEPRTMQEAPHYDDVVAEVRSYLRTRVESCRRAGIDVDRVCVDPGIGFGKRPEHNLALLAALERLAEPGIPVLIGISRKSLVGIITGRPTSERLAGSVAFAALAVMRGAAIIRAHDVAATVDAVKVASALKRAGTGGGST